MAAKIKKHIPYYAHALLGWAGAYVTCLLCNEYVGLNEGVAQIIIVMYFAAFLASFLLIKENRSARGYQDHAWMRGI